MKKISTKTRRLIIWGIPLAIIAGLSIAATTKIVENRNHAVKFPVNPTPELQPVPSLQFAPDRLDSAITANGNRHTLLVVNKAGCTTCNVLYDYFKADTTGMEPIFFEADYSPNNQMLTYALATRSYPSIYLIDNQNNITSLISDNSKQLPILLDSALNRNARLAKRMIIRDISPEDFLAMITQSMQSVIAFQRSDWDGVLHHATRSLELGSYFYNNYLLYTYYDHIGNRTKANTYRDAALRFKDDFTQFLYKDLIEGLKNS